MSLWGWGWGSTLLYEVEDGGERSQHVLADPRATRDIKYALSTPVNRGQAQCAQSPHLIKSKIHLAAELLCRAAAAAAM